MAHRTKVLRIYKTLLRECQKFNTYNYRMYFVRRTKDGFREHKNEQDITKIESLIKTAEDNLDMIRRQILVGQMYGEGHLIIEKKSPNT